MTEIKLDNSAFKYIKDLTLIKYKKIGFNRFTNMKDIIFPSRKCILCNVQKYIICNNCLMKYGRIIITGIYDECGICYEEKI